MMSTTDISWTSQPQCVSKVFSRICKKTVSHFLQSVYVSHKVKNRWSLMLCLLLLDLRDVQCQDQMVQVLLYSMSRPDGQGLTSSSTYIRSYCNCILLLQSREVYLYTWWPFMSHDTPPANQSTNVLWKSFQLVNQTPLDVKLILQLVGARFYEPRKYEQLQLINWK